MVEYTDIFVNSPIEKVKESLEPVFQQNGFKVQWSSEYGGKASRGSKAKGIAFGAFAQYHDIDFKISTTLDKTVAVRLIRSTSGLTGGLLGRRKVKKQYQKIVDVLVDHFSSKGTYKGREPK
jgi:hypothetical protein